MVSHGQSSVSHRSVMVDAFHFCRVVLHGEVAVNKTSRGAGKKNEESRRAQEPTLASGVCALVQTTWSVRESAVISQFLDR
jgi:hypothetical protein